jgi:hypothetical protein
MIDKPENQNDAFEEGMSELINYEYYSGCGDCNCCPYCINCDYDECGCSECDRIRSETKKEDE